MTQNRLNHVALGLGALLFAACGGGGKSSAEGGGSATTMGLIEVSNGFGQIVPHTIQRLDEFGNPTLEIVSVDSMQVLVDNLTLFNTILPVPKFQEEEVLPSGLAGNHFLVALFTQPIGFFSVLDRSPGSQANSGLTGAASIVALDPVTGQSFSVPGRAFINGVTVGDVLVGNPPQRAIEKWVGLDEFGKPTALMPQGLGFPGTEGNFQGSNLLVQPNAFVFVPDSNNDLSDHETFPQGFQIRLRFTTAVMAANGKSIQNSVLACTTVGDDTLTPEVLTTPPPLQEPLITPGGGDLNVDPMTNVRIEFAEPVQPLSVGTLLGVGPPGVSSAVKIQFGPDTSRTDMPFNVRPKSIFDLSVYELIPAFQFPGSGPEFQSCGTFAEVDITLNAGQVQDLARNPDPNDPNNLIPNTNLLAAATMFVTGEGPGIVNAPVTPDVIYVSRSGSSPGLSVLDLNGFGQSTGNPTFSTDNPQPENTNYPNNQNVLLQSGLRPPLAVGTCTIDGGSAGVFTLTRDSSLDNQVVRAPIVTDVTDMMLGHSLDGTFNNGSFPFGCQAGGGYICTIDGLKAINYLPAGPNTIGPASVGQIVVNVNLLPGQSNLVSWAPHPNPPPLRFPPLCISPFILGEEPTSVDNLINIPIKTNLLVPGDPFGDPLAEPPKPPSGMLTKEQNTFFLGSSQGPVLVEFCLAYQIRQQVGHFLYVIDRTRGEIAVLNSNRMTVIERISMPDPTALAIGPNLDVLAVTNQQANTVTFIDINPKSATLHQIVKTVVVGQGPRGIAWQPGNEDVLVCNELGNSLSLISAFSLEVRKTVSSQLNSPFDVVAFERDPIPGWAYLRDVYFAYILNRNGKVAFFESGPNGVNGWGFDDIIGIIPFTFKKPKAIQVNPVNLFMAAWIAHEGPLDPENQEPGPDNVGALSLLWVESAVSGRIFLGNSAPGIRDMQLAVQTSIGEGPGALSGIPTDIAFDDLRNFGGLPNIVSQFSAGAPLPANGKGIIRTPAVAGNFFQNCTESEFMFVAVPNAAGGFGVVDVFGMGESGVPRKDTDAYQPGIQSVPVPNVKGVMSYWRQ